MCALQLPDIVPTPRWRQLPLSFGQERLWFLHQLSPDSPLYNIPLNLRLCGPLNISALERSFGELVRRHEVLRTNFCLINRGPVQIIHSAQPCTIPVIDISGLAATDRISRALELTDQENLRPFDLEHDPLLRLSLVRITEEDHILICTVHHIVFDGWSVGLVRREVTALYEAFLSEKPSPLPDLPIQYADVAIWQRSYLRGSRIEKDLSYWKRQLAGATVLPLPTDRPRPSVQTFRGAEQALTIPLPVLDGLRLLSRRECGTLFMTLLAAFSVLLSRYSGQNDIVVGSPIAGRNRDEVENLVGFFVNSLVLRTDVSGDPTFLQLLKRVREVAFEAYEHQDLPFEQLVGELRPERNANRTPLFEVLFSLQNVPHQEWQLPGLTVTTVGELTGVAKLDLSVTLTEKPEGLRVHFSYNTDLFEYATITRMMEHLQNLLLAIVAQPECHVSQLSLLSEAERRKLLVEWNNTAQPYPGACIPQLFETQAEQTSDATALVFKDRSMTYRELNQRANRLAHYLRRFGVRGETLVSVCMERSPDLILALLAVLKAGGAYVPIDPALPDERIGFMLSDSAASVVITNSPIAERLSPNVANVICLDRDWSEIAAQSVENLPPTITLENLAYVIYTSGSTGRPKGVLGTHRGIMNRFHWMWKVYPFESGEVCCQKTSLSFVDSVWEIFGPLLQGIKIVIVPERLVEDPSSLIEFLAGNSITRLVLVSSLIRTMLEVSPDLARMLPRLKYWSSSGEALPLTLARQFSIRMPSAILLDLYGSSEVAADSTCYRVGESESLTCSPIGRPIANTQVYILDQYGQPAPIGVPGELHVGGDSLSRGYLNQPELTAAKFIRNPFSEVANARLYKTGDLGRYLPDGNIEYLGRSDFQIKLRGFRIELAEIEAVLAQHPGVGQNVVLAREDVPGDKRLVAYFVPRNGQEPTVAELRHFLQQKLPGYMVPSAFVLLEKFPLTASAKVNRPALPAPNLQHYEHLESVAPRDAFEATLVKIFENVLGVSPVGIKDDFFQLGGHSVLAVRLVAEISKVIGKNLPLAALFQAADVQSLASIAREGPEAWAYPLVMEIRSNSESAETTKPPFFCATAPGANALGYVALARHLRGDRKLYKLQADRPGRPAGLADRPYTPAEWEALAVEYLNAMQAVQAHGPYFLGGMCGGAHIAFDMARLLEASSERVNLVIFDTWVWENTQNRALWRVDYFHNRIKTILKLPPPERSKALHRAFSTQFSRLLRQVPMVREHVQERPLADVWVRSYWPGSDFKPKTYSGRVAVFKRSRQPYYRIRDPYLGWGKRALGGVDLHLVSAPSHRDILREPYVAELANIILDWLAELPRSGRVS